MMERGDDNRWCNLYLFSIQFTGPKVELDQRRGIIITSVVSVRKVVIIVSIMAVVVKVSS